MNDPAYILISSASLIYVTEKRHADYPFPDEIQKQIHLRIEIERIRLHQSCKDEYGGINSVCLMCWMQSSSSLKLIISRRNSLCKVDERYS